MISTENKIIYKIRDFLLDILFPKFCFGCQTEGTYLCPDCAATIEISQCNYCLCEKPIRLPSNGKCRNCDHKNLSGLYSAAPYSNKLVQSLIKKFKYEPYAKDLVKPLANLLINHLQLLDQLPDFSGFLLIPIPLGDKKIRRRGFNQAEEIAKELSTHFHLPLLDNALIKVKENSAQAELEKDQREENIKGVFAVKNAEEIAGKNILLVDDVYTTGATMEEATETLKKARANQVRGVAVARG